jgi:uncharacterized protein YdiU (UPF0061 family)
LFGKQVLDKTRNAGKTCGMSTSSIIDGDSRDPAERQAAMYLANPVFLPRNHLVAEAIDSAVNDENLGPFNALVDLLEQQCDSDPALAKFATPPRLDQVVSKTFCGT